MVLSSTPASFNPGPKRTSEGMPSAPSAVAVRLIPTLPVTRLQELVAKSLEIARQRTLKHYESNPLTE
jgi:hypothetical protein